MEENLINLSTKRRVKKIGSAIGQVTNKIIIKGNSLFQKDNSKNYSEDYIEGYILRSVGDLDDNNIYIKVSNIPVINVGDIVLSYDNDTSRFREVENKERFKEGITYYLYCENKKDMQIVVNYKQGNEDYYLFGGKFNLRDPNNYNLTSFRCYCDSWLYKPGLTAIADNVYFKDITTVETEENTNSLTITLNNSLKRIGNIYDSLDLQTGILRRCIGSRVYKSGDEKDSTVLTDFVTTLYVLENPTEEKIDVNCTTNLKLLKDGYVWLNNNIVPEVIIKYENSSIKNYGIYKNILFNGAVGDGVEDDSECFEDNFNYVPEGYLFKIDKKTSLKIKETEISGNGKIIIRDFPFEPRKFQPQGIFYSKNIKDEFKMAMNLPNEATPNGAQMRTRMSGFLSFEDAVISADFKVLNAWGEIYIIKNESYPTRSIINIANLTLLGYRESTRNWEILNNPENIDGGLYYEDYHGNTFMKVDSKIKNHVYTASIDSSAQGRVLHVWSNQHLIPDANSDFKYMCAYMDAWVTGDNVTTSNSEVLNKFLMNTGSDSMKSYGGSEVRELCSGRFLKLTNIPRRCYATNLNAVIIDEYATQSLIDSIHYIPAKYYGRTHDTPKAPMLGEYYFDYEKNKVYYWNGTSWVDSLGN